VVQHGAHTLGCTEALSVQLDGNNINVCEPDRSTLILEIFHISTHENERKEFA